MPSAPPPPPPGVVVARPRRTGVVPPPPGRASAVPPPPDAVDAVRPATADAVSRGPPALQVGAGEPLSAPAEGEEVHPGGGDDGGGDGSGGLPARASPHGADVPGGRVLLAPPAAAGGSHGAGVDAGAGAGGVGAPAAAGVAGRLQPAPAQPAKQAHAPSPVEQRPCPLQLTASSHSAPQAPSYRPAAHGSQRAPEWSGRQRQRPAAASHVPRSGPPHSASEAQRSRALALLAHRTPAQPGKQVQAPSGVQRPWPLQLARASQAVPQCRPNCRSLQSRSVVGESTDEVLQSGLAHPWKHTHAPLTPEHRPWPLQLAISWHAAPQCWPNRCSLQRPPWTLAGTLQSDAVQPSKQMHAASSPEHRPCPLQFVISLHAMMHSCVYIFVSHGPHSTPPNPARQLHVPFLQFPLVEPPQSISDVQLKSSYSRVSVSENSKRQPLFTLSFITECSPPFSKTLA